MYNVTIRFYEELNDFLEPDMRKRDSILSFNCRRSIKDLIESTGVPHVEVDLILANGYSVGFDYIVCDNDRFSVYPVFESLDITPVCRLRPFPLREISFVLDVHLRKLARRLRLLGFDVDYKEGRDDDELAMISSQDNRTLLTRDRQLLMRKIVMKGLYVRNTDPEKQVIEVLERLDLWGKCRPFTRCIECNGKVVEFNPDDNNYSQSKKIPEGVREWCNEYFSCVSCGNIYWKGSHYEKLKKTVEIIMGSRL